MTIVSCPYQSKHLQKSDYTIFTNMQCNCEKNQKVECAQVPVPTVADKNLKVNHRCLSKRLLLLMNLIVQLNNSQ